MGDQIRREIPGRRSGSFGLADGRGVRNDGSAAPDAFARLSEGLPTTGVAVYAVSGPWAGLDAGDASLSAYDA